MYFKPFSKRPRISLSLSYSLSLQGTSPPWSAALVAVFALGALRPKCGRSWSSVLCEDGLLQTFESSRTRAPTWGVKLKIHPFMKVFKLRTASRKVTGQGLETERILTSKEFAPNKSSLFARVGPPVLKLKNTFPFRRMHLGGSIISILSRSLRDDVEFQDHPG